VDGAGELTACFEGVSGNQYSYVFLFSSYVEIEKNNYTAIYIDMISHFNAFSKIPSCLIEI